jgi:thiol-disulfide isomerase/thioredoxin
MRATLPLIGLAAAVAVAAVYVSGRGPDNAGRSSAAAPAAAATVSPAGTAPAARHNSGKLAAFVYKSAPEPVPAFPFYDASQQTRTVGAFQGKVVLLNLWATWCGPCREEMPSLDRLQKELGSDRFEVVAVSVDKNGFDASKKFLDGIGIKSLAHYSDPTGRAASQVKALGMPATLLLDKDGREIGRLMGPAEWDSPDAKRLIEAALE